MAKKTAALLIRPKTAQERTFIEVLLKRRRLAHGATHDENVWRNENIAKRGGISEAEI